MYVKTVKSYDEIIIRKKGRILPKLTFWWKKFWHIPIIQLGEMNICYLPVKKETNPKHLNSLFCNLSKNIMGKFQLVLSKELQAENANLYVEKHGLTLFSENGVKKILIIKALEKIEKMRPLQDSQNIAVLCNEPTPMNMYLICELATKYKAIKIVSKHTAKFRKLEHDLYHQLGIAIQLSNSYQKSLLKVDRIINLDFSNIDINDYQINARAIIINTADRIRIRAKSFQGIVIHSYRIKYSNKLKQKFVEQNLWNDFQRLQLYAGIINWEKEDYFEMTETLDANKIKIISFIGNNGKINPKEFKIVK